MKGLLLRRTAGEVATECMRALISVIGLQMLLVARKDPARAVLPQTQGQHPIALDLPATNLAAAQRNSHALICAHDFAADI
jgi:hypothetical protein